MSEFTIETLLVKCHSIQDLNEYLANIQIRSIQYKYVSNKTLDYVNIWFMTNYSKIEIEIINISLGLTVKLRRLEYKYSQLDLGIISETDNTLIGRIERAEHIVGWNVIMLVSQKLNINFSSLFVLKTKEEVLELIEDCLALETKLTQQKRAFYDKLKGRVNDLYDKITPPQSHLSY